MTAPHRSDRLALLGFYLRDNETLIVWADDKSREPEIERAAVTAREIADATAALHRQFAPGNINFRRPEYTTDLAWLAPLGHALLAPVAERLGRTSRLVVSPHAALNALPLHMLAPFGADPLGTTHAISYVPNFSAYAALLERTGRETTGISLPSLCLATAAREDAKRVADDFLIAPRAFSQSTGGLLREGQEASTGAFRGNAGKAAILYLSCHSRFDTSDSLRSCLLLSDGSTLPSRTAESDRFHSLSVADILGVATRCHLVILDACMSGIQHVAAGDELMGFPTAFLLSGANAVIASNWSVEQNLARDFMLLLAKTWSAGGSLGDAMRHTMATLRGQYPHPFHWAVFSLFGNDLVMFPKIGAP